MFKRAYEASGIREKQNTADEGYPELNPAEQDELVLLFGASTIEAKKDENAWKRTLQDVSQDLHPSSWTLVELVRRTNSKLTRAPPRLLA